MNTSLPPKTLEQKIDYLIEDVQQIKRKIFPPWWVSILKWIGRNFFTIIGFVILGYFLWQIWELVQNILKAFEHLQTMPGEAKDAVLDQIQQWKFW